MNFEIGKVKQYNGIVGFIVSESGIYKFLDRDIRELQKISVGDYVLFRGEFVNGEYRAFFVKNVSKDILDYENKKEYLKTILLKDGDEQ